MSGIKEEGGGGMDAETRDLALQVHGHVVRSRCSVWPACYWGGFEFGNVDFGIFDDRSGAGAGAGTGAANDAAAAAAAAADIFAFIFAVVWEFGATSDFLALNDDHDDVVISGNG